MRILLRMENSRFLFDVNSIHIKYVPDELDFWIIYLRANQITLNKTRESDATSQQCLLFSVWLCFFVSEENFIEKVLTALEIIQKASKNQWNGAYILQEHHFTK